MSDEREKAIDAAGRFLCRRDGRNPDTERPEVLLNYVNLATDLFDALGLVAQKKELFRNR